MSEWRREGGERNGQRQMQKDRERERWRERGRREKGKRERGERGGRWRKMGEREEDRKKEVGWKRKRQVRIVRQQQSSLRKYNEKIQHIDPIANGFIMFFVKLLYILLGFPSYLCGCIQPEFVCLHVMSKRRTNQIKGIIYFALLAYSNIDSNNFHFITSSVWIWIWNQFVCRSLYLVWAFLYTCDIWWLLLALRDRTTFSIILFIFFLFLFSPH